MADTISIGGAATFTSAVTLGDEDAVTLGDALTDTVTVTAGAASTSVTGAAKFGEA